MDVESLADLVAVVQAGGISAGARRRGLPKQTVSRRLLALEQSLGLRLFERSTRAWRVTADGQLLFERALRILADIDDTRRALVDRSERPSGLLRLSAPVLFGQTVLGDIAARVLRAHPDLRLEIVLADRRVDLIEEGYDAAIRVGPMRDSTLVGRVFARAESFVVAAPRWAEAAVAPAVPADLERLPCILHGENLEGATWQLQSSGATEAVTVRGPATVTSLQLVLDLAREGVGIASVPEFFARPAIERGELVRLLPAWNTGDVELRIVYPSRRLVSARLRAFLDVLLDSHPQRLA